MAEVPPSNPNPPSPAPAPFIPSVPTGAVPPPKKETGKVQPKKETVRINLPPKPTAAPTIKLPTLPPGGPTGAPSAAPAAVNPPAPSAPALKTGGAPPPAAAKPAAPAPARPGTPAAKPAAVTARPAVAGVPTIKGLDKALIYVATVAALAAVGMAVWVFLKLNDTLTTFQS
jgi:hypothetical protein